MDYLIIQLEAPLSSWGETAVGEYRPTANYPSESALLGLLAAAIGIEREDEAAHQMLRVGYGFAIGVQSTGRLLRDYHTAQVPGQSDLKNKSHRSRRDELNLPKDKLNTILSTRDYRQGLACLVAVCAGNEAPYPLVDLSHALQKPKYVLCFGRKACPPSLPLWPQVVVAASALEAMEKYRKQLAALAENLTVALVEQLIWGGGIAAGCDEDIQVVRKDRLLSRKNWQFGDRLEHIAFLGGRSDVL